MRALSFLQSLDFWSIISLFWYTIIFEIPRYTIGTVIINATRLWSRTRPPVKTKFNLSIILAGHNEAKPLRTCIAALGEQTILAELGPIEVIVVDDGSTDRMLDVAMDLQREGKIDTVLRLEHRGGKSAAVNLGLSACTGDIIVISDIDTTFDRSAFAELLSYFADPRVGAVSGNLGVRNVNASLITRGQAIEYAIGISLGRSIQDTLGILSIVSGAFGAFRFAALEQVGGQDVEVGEDADLTMKLRRAGWHIRFAPDAHALTDVPETVSALIAQRLRWDRGLITIWLRKFRSVLDPRQSTFRLIDVVALADVIGFQVLLTLAFPVYCFWLFFYVGDLAGIIINATLIGLMVLNLLSFAAAAAFRTHSPFRLIIYLPLYTILQLTLMRVIRIAAIAQELIFRSSYRDTYVPARVMSQVEIV
jgi:cellulose synthase/poly-beta-1,6-N-acetylglucosamine synthase-like glycosyltransferase